MTLENKAITGIKEQIDLIVTFNPYHTLEELIHDREAKHKRLEDGLSKMSESNIFTDSEIESVTRYAFEILNIRYSYVMNAVKNTMRGSWTF